MSFISLSDSAKNRYLTTYQKFCQDPERHWKEMAKVIGHPEASTWTQELYELYSKHRNRDAYAVMLKTNGSTNINPSEYLYTYYSFMLKDAIWECMHKTYSPKSRYFINIDKFSKNLEVSDMLTNEGKTFNLNPNMSVPLDFKGACWIFNPFGLHYITFYPKVLEFMAENGITASVTEMDSSFYDFSILKEYGIPLVNQMRSWKEGTAFYTCPARTMHWMENLFYCTGNGLVDLLNFRQDWSENPDAIWPIGEFQRCQCGAWYREMHFQPHAVKWFYTKNGLPSAFRHFTVPKNSKFFQIVQDKAGSIFTVHSDGEVPEGVQGFILDVYQSGDFTLRHSTEEYSLGTRGKKPVFWSEYEQCVNKFKTF